MDESGSESKAKLSESKPTTQIIESPSSLGSPWLVLVSFAALGFVVGYFAGQSESPVVATLLPLLFGLIGTGSLFLAHIVKDNRSKARGRALAASVAIFALTCFFGSIYGSSLRIGIPLRSYIPTWRTSETGTTFPSMEQIPVRQATKLIALRSRLKLVGASDGEMRTILSRVTYMQASRREEAKRLVAIATDLLSKVRKDLAKIKATTSEESQGRRKLDSTLADVTIGEEILRQLNQDLIAGDPVDDADMDEDSNPLVNDLGLMMSSNNGEDFQALAAQAKVPLSNMENLFAVLSRLHAVVSSDQFTSMNEDLDEVLDKMAGLANGKEEKQRPHMKR